jgi:hypothetical protein
MTKKLKKSGIRVNLGEIAKNINARIDKEKKNTAKKNAGKKKADRIGRYADMVNSDNPIQFDVNERLLASREYNFCKLLFILENE